jgi:hypothetical protein
MPFIEPLWLLLMRFVRPICLSSGMRLAVLRIGTGLLQILPILGVWKIVVQDRDGSLYNNQGASCKCFKIGKMDS